MKSCLWLAAMAALLGGCTGGTETGNPSFEAKLTYTAYSSQTSVSVRQPGAPVVVNAVWLVLGDVVFAREDVCDPQAEGNPRAPGLGVGNHASDAPASTEFPMTGGFYCGTDVPFVRSEGVTLPAEAPPSLTTNTIVLEGTTEGGDTFTIESDLQSRVRLAADAFTGGFVVEADSSRLLMQFDVAEWLENVNMADATVENGSITISATENVALHDAFEAKLESGIQLVRDDASKEVLASGTP